MNIIKPILILFQFILIGQFAIAQKNLQEVKSLQSIPKVYLAKKISSPVIIDGQLDDIWQTVSWSASFEDIEGKHKTTPKFNTQMKMLWDDKNLYIYAKLEEPHIWGDITDHDAIIYHNNDFEVFIKPRLSNPLYYEIEINPLNTVMDLLMTKPYRFGGQALMHWDTKNIKSAIYHEGTINNPNDTDLHWAVELAIPFTSLSTFGSKATPQLNNYWRINFSRVQWQYELSNKVYKRKKINDKIIEEDNWVWSPIGVINMHFPEKWGFVKFITDNSDTNLPLYYEIEKTAWNIYYLQELYKHKYKKYQSILSQLEGYDTYLKNDLINYTIQKTFSDDNSYYRITLKEKDSKYYFTIDNQGNYTTNYE